MTAREDDAIVLSEERAVVGSETAETGSVRARKRVEHRTEQLTVDRGVEHADLQTEPALEEDDGQVHVLEDGSVSIPVLEEQVVVTKRLVVRERVVLRKHTVYEDHLVTADLRREHLDVDVDEAVADRVG